jgi:cytoskeleton protein RodZ
MALFERIKSTFVETDPEAETPSSGVRSVGDLLRQQRFSLDLDLSHVAAALKIKTDYLAAIEEGRHDQLPGAAYALGFVRSYSEHLGLDGAEILRRFKLEAAGLDAKPDLAFPMPLSERSLPAGGMLIAAAILAICGYGMWYHLSTAERVSPERVTEVPAALLAPRQMPVLLPRQTPGNPSDATVSAANAASNPSPVGRNSRTAGSLPGPKHATPAPMAVSSAGETPSTYKPDSSGLGSVTTGDQSRAPAAPSSAISATSAAAAVPAGSPAPLASAAIPTTAPTEASSTAVPTPTKALTSPPAAQSAGAAHVYGALADPSRITVQANADSWIQIRAADHSVLFTGMLKPGDAYRVPDRLGLSMRAGNAGGLDIIVDGKPAPSLGRSGTVRNVSLDPQTLMAQSAAHD